MPASFSTAHGIVGLRSRSYSVHSVLHFLVRDHHRVNFGLLHDHSVRWSFPSCFNYQPYGFIATLSRTISGIHILAAGKALHHGPLCSFQGIVNHVFSMAADCSVFAISVFTVFTVTRKILPSPTMQRQGWRILLATHCCIWAFASFTGFLALGMKWYTPATGNGCWLKQKPATIRILISIVPRWFFIISEILLYGYLNVFLHRHYKKHEMTFQLMQTNIHSIQIHVDVSHGTEDIATHSQAPPQPVTHIPRDSAPSSSLHSNEKRCVGLGTQAETLSQRETPSDSNEEFPVPCEFETIIDPTSALALATGIRKRRRSTYFAVNSRHERIQKILLLNAYPLGHIIFSIPGQVNRVMEFSGHTSKAGAFLQAFQYTVGFVNALTFAWNERVIQQLKKRFRRQ
ncbi:hypothetical protein JOM56_010216 [Amanita muscaria]